MVQDVVDAGAEVVMDTDGQIVYYNSGRKALDKSDNDKILQLKSGLPSWQTVSSGITESSLASTTPVSDNAENAYGTANQFLQPFTLPTDSKFYVITNITWKNGSVVSGQVLTGIEQTNADGSDRCPLVAVGRLTDQSGTDTTQSCGMVGANIWRGGDKGIVWGHLSDNTGTIRRQTGLSSERATRATAYTATPPTNQVTNCTNSTAHPYLIISYYGYS